MLCSVRAFRAAQQAETTLHLPGEVMEQKKRGCSSANTGQNQVSSTVTGGRWPCPLRMHTPGQPPGTFFSGLGQVSCWPPLCHTVPSSESSNVRNQMQSSYPAPAPSQDHRQKGLLGEGQWAKRGQVGGPAIRGPGTLTTQKSKTKGPFAKYPRVRAWEFWSSQEESRGALASMP